MGFLLFKCAYACLSEFWSSFVRKTKIERACMYVHTVFLCAYDSIPSNLTANVGYLTKFGHMALPKHLKHTTTTTTKRRNLKEMQNEWKIESTKIRWRMKGERERWRMKAILHLSYRHMDRDWQQWKLNYLNTSGVLIVLFLPSIWFQTLLLLYVFSSVSFVRFRYLLWCLQWNGVILRHMREFTFVGRSSKQKINQKTQINSRTNTKWRFFLL